MAIKESEVIALYLSPNAIDKRSGYLSGSQTIKLAFVRTSESGKTLNPSDSTFENPFIGFADLHLTAQWNTDKGNDGKTYAWECEYREVYSIDCARAEAMVKMLKKVRKVVAEFPVQPETFGQFVALILQGLKVSKLVRPAKGTENTGWSYSEVAHSEFDAKDAQYMVDAMISAARPTAEVEASK